MDNTMPKAEMLGNGLCVFSTWLVNARLVSKGVVQYSHQPSLGVLLLTSSLTGEPDIPMSEEKCTCKGTCQLQNIEGL